MGCRVWLRPDSGATTRCRSLFDVGVEWAAPGDLACSEDAGHGDRPLVTIALAKVASRTTSSTVAGERQPGGRWSRRARQ